MGRRCCVPHCYTGYTKSKDREKKETGSLFKVPDDDYFRDEWHKAIARADRMLTPKDFVCYKHFTEDDFIKRRYVKNTVEEYKNPRLKPDAVPSLFPDLPDYILKMCKKRRKMPEPIKEDPDKETDVDNLVPELLVHVKEEPIETPTPVETNTPVETPETEKPIDITNGEITIKTEIEEEPVELYTGPKMYKCDECSYQSTYKNNIQTHQTKHEQEFKYFCDFCPKFRTKWQETYKNHMRVKHDVGPQRYYNCSLCPFQTKIQVSWKRHMNKHNELMGIVSHSCHICKFICGEASELKEHHMQCHQKNGLFNGQFEIEHVEIKQEPISEHSSSIPQHNLFFCDKCSYVACSQENLEVHQKVKHNAYGFPKVLKCAICDFTSKTILCLKLHMRKHSQSSE